MAGYIGKSQGVTQVDGYNRTEADDRYVNASGDTMTGALEATNFTQGGSQVYSRNNIIGATSQASGVPTGAVIEQGSNANGNYVKYADGTMLAWKRVNFSGITLNPANGSANSALGLNLTMAAAFVGTPSFSHGQIRLQDSGGFDVYGGTYTYDGTLWIFHSGLRPTNVWPRWDATSSFVVTQGFYEVKAVGRWF